MRVVMLYRTGTEGENQANDYVAEFTRRHPDKPIELVDVDSRDGEELARLYQIFKYPAVLALAHDGGLQQLWQDEHLPLMDEVDFYLQAD